MAQQGVHFGDLITLLVEEKQNSYLAKLLHTHLDGLSVLSADESVNADAIFTQSCVFRIHPTTLKNEKYENGRPLHYGVFLKLEHIASRKVLTVNPFAHSDLERTNLKVSLQEARDSDANQLFKIMPRFRAQVEGDKVRVLEEVYFATRQSNEFLHVSTRVHQRQELNVSASPTSFQLASFASYHPEGGKYLKAGDVIRLFHKEVEGFLSASFEYMGAQSNPLCDADAAYVRTTRSKKVDKIYSSNQLWMIEFETARIGGLVGWSQRIRLKHVASGKYLAMVDQDMYRQTDDATGETYLKLGLTNNLDDCGLWIFSPVTQAGSTVTLSSYVRLIHWKTRRYLHTTAEWYLADRSTSKACPVDDKVLRQVIGGTTELHGEDVFHVKTVSKDQIQLLRSVAGMRQILIDLIVAIDENITKGTFEQFFCQSRIPSAIAAQAKAVMSAMILLCTDSNNQNPLTRDGPPLKEQQTLLFDQRIHDVIFHIIRLFFSSPRLQEKADDVKGVRFQAVWTLCIYGYRLIKQMAKQNKRAGSYLFEKYLTFMQQHLGYHLKVADTLMEIVKDNRRSLDLISKSDMPAYFLRLIESGRRARYLNFLAALCVVNGSAFRDNQDLLTRILLQEKPELLLQTKVETGKPAVYLEDESRWIPVSRFARLQQKKQKGLVEYFNSQLLLFANITMNRHEESTRIIRERLSAEYLLAVMTDTSVPMCIRINCVALITNLYVDCNINEEKPVIVYIREWDSADMGRISVDDRSIELVSLLKKFVEKELPNGSEPVSLADPRLPKYMMTQDPATHTRGMSVVLDPSMSPDETLQMIWGYAKAVLQMTARLVALGFYSDRAYNLKFQDKLIAILRNTQGREDVEYQNKETFQPLTHCKLEICKILNTFFDLTINFRITDVLEMYRGYTDLTVKGESVVNDIRRNFNKHIREKWNHFKPFSDPKQEEELRNLLADLSLYQNRDLVRISLQLLIRLYTEGQELCSRMKDVQILANSAHCEMYRRCQSDARRLRDYCESVPKLNNSVSAVVTILQEWVSLLRCPDNVDLRRTQNMFRHLRVHEVLFSVLDFPFTNRQSEQPRRPVLLLTYEFLSLFTKGNYENQLLCIPVIPSMLPQLGWKLKVANTLTEIFRNNRSCARQAEDSLIDKIVNVMASGNLYERYPIFLKNLVFSEGLFLKENQNRVMKALLNHQDSVMMTFTLGDHEGFDFEKVKQFLKEEQLSDPDSILNYHLALVDLLGCCTLGGNEFCESKSRALLSLRDCISVILEPELPLRMKRVYMMFLNEAYFATVEDPAIVLRRIEEAHTVSSEELKELFAHVMTSLEQFCKQPDVDEETRAYLFEAVVPLCMTFFERFFVKDEEDEMLLEDLSKEAHGLMDILFGVRRVLGSTDERGADAVLQALKAAVDSGIESKVHGEKIRKAVAKDQDAIIKKRDMDQSVLNSVPEDLGSLPTYLQIEMGYPLLCRIFADVVRDYDEVSDLIDFFATALDCVIQYRGGPPRPKFESRFSLFGAKEAMGTAGKIVAGGVDMVTGGALAAAKAGVFVMETAASVANLNSYVRIEEGEPDLNTATRTLDNPRQAEKVIRSVIRFFRCYGTHHMDHLVVYLKVFRGMVNDPDETVPPEASVEGSRTNIEYAQRIMTEFGAAELVPSLLTIPDKRLASAALELSIRLLHGGNTFVQHEVMRIMGRAASTHLFQEIRDQFRDFILEIKTRQPEDCNYIQNILRFLQLLCEGHNRDLQNYLREQVGSIVSVDIVKEVATLFNAFVEDFCNRLSSNRKPSLSSLAIDLSLLVQIANTMSEACQGPCKENQSALVEEKVCDSVDDLLERLSYAQDYYISCSERRPTLKERYDEAVDGIRGCEGAVLTTLNSIVEGNTNRLVLERMISSIDVNNILRMLENHWKGAVQFLEDGVRELEDEVDLCIKYYILLRVLAENDDVSHTAAAVEKWEAANATGCPEKMLEIVGRIEILRGKSLERLYFPVPRVAREQFKTNILVQERSSLKYDVNRDNPGEKVADFLRRMDDLIYVMRHQDRMYQYQYEPLSSPLRWLYHINSAAFYCQWLTMLFAVTLNLLIIFTFREHQGNSESDAVDTAIDVLGAIHLLTSFGRLVSFFTCWYSVIMYRCDVEDYVPDMPFKSVINVAYAIVTHKQAFFQIVYTFFAILALFDPCFYSFHLTDLLGKFRLLAYALESVTRNIRSLSQTLLLGFVIIYIYSVVGWRLFWEDQYEFGDAGPFNDNMLQWVMSHWDYGLRSAPLRSNPETLGFFFFGLSYFLLVVLILGAIISGIIIDTFGELRDEKAAKEDDMVNVCFMCGLTRDVLDQRGKGFEDHIRRDHNMWQYVFLKMHLEEKPKNDYTGQESYVAEKINQKDTSVFPLRRAMIMEKHSEDSGRGPDGHPFHAMSLLEEQVSVLTQQRETTKDATTTVLDSVGSLHKQVESTLHAVALLREGFAEQKQENAEKFAKLEAMLLEKGKL